MFFFFFLLPSPVRSKYTPQEASDNNCQAASFSHQSKALQITHRICNFAASASFSKSNLLCAGAVGSRLADSQLTNESSMWKHRRQLLGEDGGWGCSNLKQLSRDLITMSCVLEDRCPRSIQAEHGNQGQSLSCLMHCTLTQAGQEKAK